METTRRSPFGIALRHFREACGLSQEQLAERAGLSLRGVSDLERGLRTTPRLETVTMLAEGLGLDKEQRARLLAARNADGQSTIPPTKNRSGRLPMPPTSFVGRSEEIGAITNILVRDNARLLTLTGPGGVGKTRIAIEVAHRVAGNYSNGALFVNLSPIRRTELVVPAIASRLGIPGQAHHDIREQLLVALQGQSMLLVLDNLEQVIDAANDIAELLAACPLLTVIVTSRVLLRLAAEHVVLIDPMSLPSDDDEVSLLQSEAVSLFVARANAANLQFTLGKDNADSVVSIVNRLQGMPLAIELAAARVRHFPVTSLLRRMDSQLPILADGVRDSPDRHRTMRDTIAWSYELLSSTEQAAFRTLAIFPEGCTLETAIALLGVENRFTEVEALDAIESLVDASILRPREDPNRQVRYRMLQTLQEFGLEQLATTGEEGRVRRAAHDAWCVPLARKIEFVRALPNASYWFNHLGAEYQNVRGHISWLIGESYMEDALDISGSLAAFRAISGYFDEGRRELEMLLAQPQNQTATVVRMKGLLGLGTICAQQADPVGSISALEISAELARELHEERHLARALLGLGQSLALIGEFDEAEKLTREGLSVGVTMGDQFLGSGGDPQLGLIADQRGDIDRAYELIDASLTASLAFGSLWDVARATLNLGYMKLRRGEPEKAEKLILESEQRFIELGDRQALSIIYHDLADIARLRGDLEAGEKRLEQALGIANEIGSMLNLARSHSGLAKIAFLKGEIEISQMQTCLAINWYKRCGNVVDAVQSLDICADVAIEVGDFQRAAWCIGAVDGVIANHGISRTDLVPGEHRARVASVMSRLGEDEWQLHHSRGHSMTSDEILAEVKSWLSCHTFGMATSIASGQTAQSGYDDVTN